MKNITTTILFLFVSLSITYGQEVGIGLTNPTNKLDILAGSTRTGSHPSNRPLYVTGNMSSDSNGIEFRHANGTQGIGIGYNTIYATGNLMDQDLGLMSRGTGSLKFTAGYIQRMLIQSNGNIGIGLNSANNRVDISNGSRTGNHSTNSILYVTGNLGPASGVEFRTLDGEEGIGFGKNTMYASGWLPSQSLNISAKGPAGGISLNTSGSEIVRVADYQVGILVHDPNEDLEVGGTGRVFIGNGGGQGREGLLIDGVEPGDYTRLESYDYGAGTGLDLVINTTGGGKVGIGTASPTHKLHVNGNAKIVGNTYVDGILSVSNGLAVNEDLTLYGNITLTGSINNDGFTAPSFQNGFSNFNNGFATAGFYKDREGRVHLRGLVTKASDPDNAVIFQLPVGSRPSSGQLSFIVMNNGNPCRVDVFPSGNVQVISGDQGTVCLDQISFRAD